jgi:cytochrome c oxidase subunit 2
MFHDATPTQTAVEGIQLKLKYKLPITFAAMMFILFLLVPATFAQSAPRRIEVTAKCFEFTPGEITLKKGEPVVLVIQSLDAKHGLRFKELGIETKVNKGQTSELAFTPEKTGTFVGHCIVFCGSGHGKMTLTLHIVE